MFGPRLRTNVHPTSSRRRPGSRHGCLSSVLFLIRRLTLRPLVEDTSDKSQTLEGVTLEQKTPYLICIWTLQGSLVNLSIYIFEFVGCSEKKWEVGETCPASRGIFIFQFSLLFLTCYSVSKQQTTASVILSIISGNRSKDWGGVKIPSDNTNAQPMASC